VNSKKFDMILYNGNIINGLGEDKYNADVGIKDGMIDRIGNLYKENSDFAIDASDLVVAPGFIDLHTHHDSELFLPKKATDSTIQSNINYLKQGVTTIVTGNCGDSQIPINKWLEIQKKKGTATNIITLVGQGSLRSYVMGGNFDRAPSREELNRMKELVFQALQEGAVGISTGLEYPPGFLTSTEELMELAKVVAEYGGIYATHLRNQDKNLLGAVAELISIVEEAGCTGQLSHFKIMGKRNFKKISPAIGMIEEARNKGLEIGADVYPYLAGSTILSIVLPQWVLIGETDYLKRLKDSSLRQKIRNEMIDSPYGWWPGWDRIVITSLQNNIGYLGMSIQEIADLLNKDPYFTTFDLLIEEEGHVLCLFHTMCEEDLHAIMATNWTAIASDGIAVPFGEGMPHPRNYGTFPRVLGKYVREEKLLSLEDAIRKMTSLPAKTVFLNDRGVVEEGFWADIVLFDQYEIIDMATYTKPHQYNVGIEYVIVNGKLTIKKGEYTGILSGKIIKPLQ